MNNLIFSGSIFLLLLMPSCGDKNSTSQKKPTSQKSSSITLVAYDSAFFNNTLVLDTVRKAEVVQKTINFYQWDDVKNETETRWLLNKGTSKLFNSLLETLGNAEDYGLSPEMYSYNYLRSKVKDIYAEKNPDHVKISQLDRDATAAFMLFIIHLNRGQITDPGSIGDSWFRSDQLELVIEDLPKLSYDDNIACTVELSQPNYPFYFQLREQLRKLNHSKPRGIISFEFHELDKFEVCFEDEKIKYLRNNLDQWGISVEMNKEPYVVDSSLIESLKSFQQAFSMEVDGLPGPLTLQYLNMADDELKKLLALNLERMKWLPGKIAEHLIMVNIPEYELRVYHLNELDMQMKVIVGQEMKATPVFGDTISHIVFNPTWTVPQSIIWEEMVPKLKINPGHYSQSFKIYRDNEELDHYQVDWQDQELKQKYYFRFVQQPGRSNALGAVKFMFPNNLSIYLHDTSAGRLFDKTIRDLSHGCIRIEEPFKLANYLLSDNKDWSKEKMNLIAREKEPKSVYLNQPYHVQISYFTAWVDGNGKLRLFDDIYGYDKEHLEKLEKLRTFAVNSENNFLNCEFF
ncbi:MAG: murein L,D-transpeptidase YcbB/YkuD [Parvicella sp.]